jgi:hypothetical protein
MFVFVPGSGVLDDKRRVYQTNKTAMFDAKHKEIGHCLVQAGIELKRFQETDIQEDF